MLHMAWAFAQEGAGRRADECAELESRLLETEAEAAVHVGINPVVTLEKQLLDMAGNLV